MKRLFGTDGIRGVAGSFPLDDRTVERIGRALARTLRGAAGHPPRLVIGRDTRESGPGIEAALVRGLAAERGRADRGGVLTTPAIACVTRLCGYDAGIVVSASHNPYRDNGIKVFDHTGQKLPDALEGMVEREVLDGSPGPPGEAPAGHGSRRPAAATAPAGDPGAEAVPAGTASEELAARYLAWLRRRFEPEASLAGWRVAVDCAHGAASALAPALYRGAGAEVIVLNAAPDGRNINEGCGALHPQGLAAEVLRREARLGLAFDGDADRCLVVDAAGRILDGDYLLYLAARDLKEAGRLPRGTVVGTVMSNFWLEEALGRLGIGLVRAPVGDKYVLEEMLRGGHALGGEQSGHIIFLDRSTAGDGLLTGLWLLDLLRRTGLDLAGWAAAVRPCPQVLVNVPVKERPPLDSHPRISAAIREEESLLRGRGRLLVRYSGTEPKARIMVEGESRPAVEECAARLRRVIQEEIGQEPV
jgi:phosphoglucosamine mutase